jgi:hypothetical protein
MPETVAIDRPSVAKPGARPRSRKPAIVSASALAQMVARGENKEEIASAA